MGNSYSLLNNHYDERNILSNEIVILENNIKKINNILKFLSNQCDTIITKAIKIDKQVYELIDCNNLVKLNDADDADDARTDSDNLHDMWDYSDLQLS